MDISVVIPSHKEPYIQETIDSIYAQARDPKNVEVIVVLDEVPPEKPLKNCIYVQTRFETGMRTSINMAVSHARGKFILKCDGHVLFKPKFDRQFLRDHKEGYVIVPMLYGLKPEQWRKWGNRREFFLINRSNFRGSDWPKYAERMEGQTLCDLMTFQGSCWFMSKDWFEHIGGEDDVNYAGGGREAQEISIKTWTMGGRCVLDRNLWYGHWRKPREHSTIRRSDRDRSRRNIMKRYVDDPKFQELIERFKPVPSWHIPIEERK